MAIRQKKISHAYILEGEKGTGKKMMAEAFARILMCEAPVDRHEGPAACGRCQSCDMFSHRDHPDVVYVEHEKPAVITVDDIRSQVVNTVDVIPYKGPYKIYIIDEAEKMNPPAQNAILKTIEEPPGYAVILLLTANRGALLPTICSRCILLPMQPVRVDVIKDYLIRECGAGEEAASYAAAFSMGNTGKAREVCLSGAFRERKDFGLSLLRELPDLADYAVIRRLKDGKSQQYLTADYLDMVEIWFRDVLVAKAAGDENRLIFREEYEYLTDQGRLLGYEELHDIIRDVEEARLRLKANVNPDTVLELLHISIRNRYRFR